MKTPIYDFLQAYRAAGSARFHMPGHKGRGPLGCEALDITEIPGADALYEARGIIAQSEANAAALFGAARTLYSTEGSSQCIRAMLYLALAARPAGTPPVVVAARNVHRAFVHAAALLDLTVIWLWPRENRSLCGCDVDPQALDDTLAALPAPPACVYVTSPDYLGGMADIAALAGVCRRRGTLLAVDNAHGAYLRFLSPSAHPLDLGAALCCDSAHKTLPVLTGGAYLHLGKAFPESLGRRAKDAMALFGSTSPSYLTLASLDLCNRTLAEGYPARLAETAARIEELRRDLRSAGWEVEPSDPLRLTLRAPQGLTGTALAQSLAQQGVVCEYADRDFLVLMATPENAPEDFARLLQGLGPAPAQPAPLPRLPLARGERAASVRQALMAPQETVPVSQSLGRICGAPTVACPPAIPIAVSGERIGPEALAIMDYYGVETVDVAALSGKT